MPALPLESIAVWNDDDIRHRLKQVITMRCVYSGRWGGFAWHVQVPGQDLKSGQDQELPRALNQLTAAYRIALHDAFLELRDAWDEYVGEMEMLNNQLQGVNE